MKLSEMFVGQRVRVVDGIPCYGCREGVIIEVCSKKEGALVKHDTPDLGMRFDLKLALRNVRKKTELHPLVEALASAAEKRMDVWGWHAHEIEPVDEVVN